jgi:alkylhydroperoxidase family enzyme
MARLPLTEPEQLPDYLRKLHDGAEESDWSTQHVARVFAPAPDLLEHYLTRFYYPWHSNAEDAADVARLTPRLKELVRLRIATLNGCQTCKAARLAADSIPEQQALDIDGYEASGDYSAEERVAMRFAEKLAVRHFDIDEADIVALRDHFDDAEILELMMMAGQYIGFGRVLAVLQLETVACPLPAATG